VESEETLPPVGITGILDRIGRYWRVRYAGGEMRYYAIMDREDLLAQEFANYVSGAPKAGPGFFSPHCRRPAGFRGLIAISFDAISDVEEVSASEYVDAIGQVFVHQLTPADKKDWQNVSPVLLP